MALTDKLTAIADAIREKSGKSDKLTLDEIPSEISALSSEELLKANSYPSYITAEVLEVANKVHSVQKNDSITFIAMSDSHYPAEQEVNFYDAETIASTIQANQATKALTYLLKPDFVAHLGDVSCGANTTTPDMLKEQIEGFISYFREAKSDLPVFICIGNHDTGIEYHDEQTDGEIHTMTGEYLYNNFTAYSECSENAVGGKENGGYCYRDFEDKKLRVIMLNTSEKLVARQIDNTTFGSQRLWLANVLLDLNTKSDATSWGFIILSHYPADYGATMKLSHLLEAYVEGTSFTITDPADSNYYKGDGTNETVNFSGKNGARFMAQFHGHIHNFLTSKLYSNANGSLVEYDAWRMCIPNGQFNRENTYTTDGNGINFADTQKYTKKLNTADGTSFVVNVINPSEEKIYSFCYGAGPEKPREIFYNFDKKKYNITNNLTNISNSNTFSIIQEGNTYIAQLSAIGGYSLPHAQVSITMGGVSLSNVYNEETGIIQIENVTGDIIINAKTEIAEYYTIQRTLQNASSNKDTLKIYPSSDGIFTHSEKITLDKVNYYFETLTVIMNGQSTGTTYITTVESQDNIPGYCEINIPNVTSNIEITAIAKKQPTTNLGIIAESEEDSNIAFNNGLGYINDYRLSNGAISNPSIVQEDGYVTTGFIRWNIVPGVTPPTIEIKGVTLNDTDNKCRMYFCNSAKSKNIIPWIQGGSTDETSTKSFASSFTIEKLEEQHYKLIPIMNSYGNWIGNQGNYPGAYFRLTLKGSGEDFIVNVGDAIAENTSTIVQNLTNVTSSNQQTLINNGDSFSTTLSPKVDYVIDNITILMGGVDITNSVYNNYEIYIPNVIGNIVITATAEKDSSTPYTNQIPNSIGLDEKPYNPPYGYKTGLRLNSSNTEVEKEGMCLTGFIKCKVGNTIRIKNVTISGSATPYIIFDRFLSNNSYNSEGVYNTCGSFSTNDLIQDSNGIITVTIPDTMSDVNYLRLSCGTIDETSILTINEDII